MELKRLERSIADRWALVVGIALFGVVAALIFGSIANRNQSNLFEATAAIRFVQAEGEPVAALAEEISSAQTIATIAAEDLLETQPGSLIVADLANSRLTFVAQGTSPDEATARADALLDSYLNVDPQAGVAVEDLIEDIQSEAAEIREEIEELQPEEDPEITQLTADHALIDAKIEAIQSRLVALVVEMAGADPEVRQGLQAEQTALNDELGDLRDAKDTLGELPDQQLSVEDSLRLSALESRLEALTADYERLYLRQSGVTEEGGGIDQTVVRDLTPEPVAPVVNALLGFFGGLLIAVFAIMFLNRTRQPIWLAQDLEIPLLGTVPARRVSGDASENWYDTAEPGERKSAIQAIRATIEAQVPATGSSIGLTSSGVASEGVQALAADLASSLASAGTSVLLVDANFSSRSPVGQYKVGGASVANVLSLNPSAPEFDAHVRHTVESAFMVRSGLSVVPSGPPPSSPADALAGRQFRQLVSVGQEMHDIVIVVVDEVESPAAQVAMQRLGYSLLVLTPGSSTIPAVEGSLRDLERLRVNMIGAVFLGKLRRLTALGSSTPKEWDRPRQEDPGQSPVSRLQTYPILDERNTAVVQRGSLDDLAIGMGSLEIGGDVGAELIETIRGSDADVAHSHVAHYLGGQVTDMVLARHGHGGLSPDLVGAMSDYGFMTLRPLKGFRSASGWLAHEIVNEIGEGEATRLIETLEEALGRGGDPVRIDDWLDAEFFARHLEETDGEPVVWHLASSEHTVSILVPARRMTIQQFELIWAEVASRAIDDLERFRSASVTRSDQEQAAMYEEKIAEVRSFEAAIRRLTAIDSDGVRRKGTETLWRPDWSRGTRANLAPLQEAGLLPFDVLGPEELSDSLASV